MARRQRESADKIGMDRTDELMRLVFRELKARGGSGRPKDILAAVGEKASLTPYEIESTDWFRQRGLVGPRWDTHVRFWTTACSRAGYLKKSGGIWELTESGEKALRLPEGQLIREASRLYRESRTDSTSPSEDETVVEPRETEADAASISVILEKAKEDARAAIDEHLDSLGAYEFQDLVAELLQAMGYHVRHVAPPGADGGLDILAYRDPLGTQVPHIKVQVKHRKSDKMDVREIRQMIGVLHKDTDIGLLVSSCGFTPAAEREISQSSRHLDRIDRERLLTLWIQNYERLSERGKRLLPLVPVYFLAPERE